MDLKNITNLDLLRLIENSSELFRLKKYRNKDFVKSFLGLGVHRSFFYGRKHGDVVQALNLKETVFNSPDDIVLQIEGVVQLTSTPVNNGAGDLFYSGYGIVEVDGNVIYDGRGVFHIQDKQLKVTYYELIDISSTTSGSLQETPTGAIIQENQFGESGNAVLSTLTGSSTPTFETPLDGVGESITASLDTSGNWASSDNYTGQVAILYSFIISFETWDTVDQTKVVDFFQIQNAHSIDYDNTLSSLTATDVNAAIDELDAKPLEALDSNSTNVNAIYVPDGSGGVESRINPVGIFFQSDITLPLVSAPLANRFIMNGDFSTSVTLPLESTVDTDYAILIENLSTKAGRIVGVQTQGTDTISGAVVVNYGEMVTVERVGVGQYATSVLQSKRTLLSNLITPGNFSVGNTLFDDAGDGTFTERPIFISDVTSLQTTLDSKQDELVSGPSDVDIVSGTGITIEPTTTGAIVYIDPSGGDINATLNSASLYEGMTFTFKRLTNGSNIAKFTPATGEFIDNISSLYYLAFGRKNDALTMYSNGTNWIVLDRYTTNLAVIQCSTPGSTQALTLNVAAEIDCFDANITSSFGRLTADSANNKIIIENKEDLVIPYHVHFKLIGEFDVNTTELDIDLYVDGVFSERLASQFLQKRDKKYTILGDTVITFMGSVPSDITLKIISDNTGTLTYDKLTLSVNSTRE